MTVRKVHRKVYGAILGIAIFLLGMSGAFNPAQAITEQNVAGRGWWAVTGNGLAAGPFPDGISAARWGQGKRPGLYSMADVLGFGE